MDNWYEVIEPHEDIKEGNFDASVFAADLDKVYSGDATPDYQDPYQFFQKTYLTKGLRNLLDRVNKRIKSGKGDHVLNIQTPFGGGKTHALITLYHYLNSGEDVEGLLPNELDITEANTAVMVGTALNPATTNEFNGIEARTYWGAIGAQLGGKEGYEFFRENDETLCSPGDRDLIEFLSDHEPVVILMDEILHYINRAHQIDAQESEQNNLGHVTNAFCQELTQAVSELDNSIVIATLPASELEDFGPDEAGYLGSLQKTFGRKEGIETPVEPAEISHIVRNRLFSEVKDESKLNEIVESYYRQYQGSRTQFPEKAREYSYREKIEKAYPFHPDLIDLLYQKWGTIHTFQRTRGVLQLLGLIVGDLYQREINSDLILPGHVNLENNEIRRGFIKHIGDEYDGVIDKDITSENANAVLIDNEEDSKRHMAQRLSTAIFLNSFTAESSQAGADIEDLRLDTLNADQEPAIVGDFLHKLENKLWFLTKDGKWYQFEHVPNLNRMVQDRKEVFADDWMDELERRIMDKNTLGQKMKVIPWPEDSNDVPDNTELKLVLLSPEQDEDDLYEILENCGQRDRVYGNTLLFSIPDDGHLNNLRETIKEYLALQDIERGFDEDSLEDPRKIRQKEKVEDRIEDIEKKFSRDIRNIYRTVQINGWTKNLGSPDVFKESISGWHKRELEKEEKILDHFSPRLILRKYLDDREEISSSTVKEQFFKNKDLPMVTSEDVILVAIKEGVTEGIFGLAYKSSDEDYDEVFFEEEMTPGHPNWDEDEVLITSERAKRVKKAIESEEEIEIPTSTDGSDEGEVTVSGEKGEETETKTEENETTVETIERYQNVHLKVSDIPASAMFEFMKGVIKTLQSGCQEVNVSVEVDAEGGEGVPEDKIDSPLKETLRQLQDQHGIIIEEEDME